MTYNPNIHQRKSIRLKGYDYSQVGLYFITICVQERACLFGEISMGEMILNDAGDMVQKEWSALSKRFTNIELHEFVVMPNHFHAILQIVAVGAPLVGALLGALLGPQNDVGAQIGVGAPNGIGDGRPPDIGRPQGHAPTVLTNKTVGDMMDAFKSITTVEYIHGVKTMGWEPFNGKLWQRNYYEHIIRNEQSFQTIADYIINNPAKWANDKLFKS